jgi:tripartite-type tricarboxylate transporter receptor subunit TctC
VKRRAVAVAMALAACLPLPARTDTRPVRLVVPVAAGGSLDTTARLIAQHWLARGTTAVVDNKPGANTLIGADAVAHAPPDGYTLLYASTALAIAPFQAKTPFNPDTLAPVMQVSTETFGLVAARSGGIDSADALRQLALARPGGINCIAVPGVPEIACEQLKAHLNGRSTTVPFQSLAPATTALLGGHGDVLFSPMVSVMPLLRGGQARLIAISSRTGLPDDVAAAPLASELWKGFVLEGFTGVFAPSGVTEERVRVLNRELQAILLEPDVLNAMRANLQAPAGGTPAMLAELLRQTQARYHEVMVRLNLAAPR